MKYHNYIFITIKSSFRDLLKTKQTAYKTAFLKEIKKEKNVSVYSYATLALKVNTNILLWIQSDSIENNQNFIKKLMHSELGNYLIITYTLFGMTRPTQYSPGSSGHLDTSRKGGAYLTIYPFTKTHAWYTLKFEERKKFMQGHIAIGRRYPQIVQLLLYSYGIDDNEFIVSYEMDDLMEFQSLIIELRSDDVRAYTLKDTPIFTCVYKSLEEILTFL